jgi:dihydroxy-acid dehydratase
MTKEAFENAMVVVMATGGSTNAVIHLIAMAKTAGVDITLADFQRVSDSTPFIANLKPSGEYVMEDLHNIGGTPGLIKYLLSEGLLHGDCLTVSGGGTTLAETVANLPSLQPFDQQDVLVPVERPVKATGHITVLRGNLAPDGAVAKITGKEGAGFRGPAKVFDSEEEMLRALEQGQIKKGCVVVIRYGASPRSLTKRCSREQCTDVWVAALSRYEGPRGGPGMPEMLTPTSAMVGAGLADHCALVTDGRFSGASHGFIIGHVCPEAQEGGTIALVQDGDLIRIDCTGNNRTIELEVPEDALLARRSAWCPPPLKVTRGSLFKYAKCVSSASEGCVTDM